MRLGEPHGGRLVDRRIDTRKTTRLKEEAQELPKVIGNSRILSDIWQIAVGGFSPLEGFMIRDEYISVIKNARLPSGLVWSFPIILPVKEDFVANLKIGDDIAIFDNNKAIAIMHISDIYMRDKKLEMEHIFLTSDPKHPGVKKILAEGNYAIGGKIDVIDRPKSIIPEKELEPRQTRKIFSTKGWKTIIAFQTRNIPHKAHEYLQRIGLEITDGLFIHPIIGERKKGDYPPQAIIEAYEWMINNIYPKDRVLLSFLWTWMRFAGPREALHHCIVRKNYGATHHIIGRLHASPAEYYGEYQAHEYLKQFSVDELGIQPVLLKGPFYCKRCGMVATENTCGHDEKGRIKISMTFIREKLKQNKINEIPLEIIRPEILEIAKKYIKYL